MGMRSGRALSAGEAADATLNGIFRSSPAWSRAKQSYHLWRAIAKGPLRAHTCGVSIQERRVSKELVVFVDSNVWMVDFDMRKQDILQQWNMCCKMEGRDDLIVQNVSFRLAKSAREAGQAASFATSDPGQQAPRPPLTLEEREYVEKQTAAISDERLREHAKKAMISVLQWKKSKG